MYDSWKDKRVDDDMTAQERSSSGREKAHVMFEDPDTNPLPCPFCGNDDIHYNGMAAVCICGASGPDFCATKAIAFSRWNGRK